MVEWSSMVFGRRNGRGLRDAMRLKETKRRSNDRHWIRDDWRKSGLVFDRASKLEPWLGKLAGCPDLGRRLGWLEADVTLDAARRRTGRWLTVVNGKCGWSIA
ncbi:hypothetical protein IMZ48_06235 [Candidatus Bathyarchaeota archaeon]|nr:hypothetical protein [Candidatus Bathyarchaeota archaeon]